MTDDATRLRNAAIKYREEVERMEAARLHLADTVRAAYQAGMRKADILRAIDHVWSREWLDRTLAEETR